MANRILPVTVIKLFRSVSLRLLLAFVLLLPVVGKTQESVPSENPVSTNAVTASDAKEPKPSLANFTVSPKRCVTLRQGQPCFVRITFKWQSSELIKACVLGVEGKELKCWESSSDGSAYIAQSLPNTTDFVLVSDEGAELSRATVSVAWVYKKKRSKRRWRLF